jgi:CRISPR-associated protein Cmr4
MLSNIYKQAYGTIETLSPLHVGATAGEEAGNLNLVFRDQFTQTGIVPGSSIRGRFRADMRQTYGEAEAKYWYGDGASSEAQNTNNESIIKFEYASVVWIPVFCPGQPIVWVSCPYLLKRYKRITGKKIDIPDRYTGSSNLKARESQGKRTLFFNLGFLTVNKLQDLSEFFPDGNQQPAVIVDDPDMAMIHDMALYRQSRVRLKPTEKVVDGGGFFNTEALPEGTILIFPIAIKQYQGADEENKPNGKQWQPFGKSQNGKPAPKETEMYLGGLESIGFGHCVINLKGI